MHIVLVEPEIPQNTGNIARTCAVTGASLHLVKPLGFSTDDRYLKRAGLDYWKLVKVIYYENLHDFFQQHAHENLYYATTKGGKDYTTVNYRADDYLLFGKETRGLPDEVLRAAPSRCLRIPMVRGARTLNLGNAVAVILYEALRQLNFPGMC